MKISELNTQSFLGGANVPANSYVLINYAESANGTPVTKKVSVQELGNAIAKELHLPSVNSDINGKITSFHVKSVSNGAYSNDAVTLPDFDVRDTYTVEYHSEDMDTVLVVADNENNLYTVNSSNRATPLAISGGIDPSVPIELSGIDGGEDFDTHLTFMDDDMIFYTINECGTSPIYGPQGKPWIVYDSSNLVLGYLADPTLSGVSSILAEPMTITPSDENGASVDSYFCVTDSNGEAFYNCADSGSYLEVLRTGHNPVVVYDSTNETFGYYVAGSENMTTLNLGGENGITYNENASASVTDTKLYNGDTRLAMSDIYPIESYQPDQEHKNIAFVGEYNNDFYKYSSSTSSWETLNVAFIDTVNGQTVIKDGDGNIVGTLGTYTPAT